MILITELLMFEYLDVFIRTVLSVENLMLVISYFLLGVYTHNLILFFVSIFRYTCFKMAIDLNNFILGTTG